jgi:hypothetical protein
MGDATAGLSRLGSPFAQLADGQWAVMQGDLFSDLGWEPYTRRWPRSGISARGLCFARPTWVPPTAETGSSSSLLLTPTAQLAINGGSQTMAKRREGGHGPTLADQVERDVPPWPVLPTPTAADGDRSSLTYERGNPTLFGALLPTPRTTDRGSTEHPSPAQLRGTHGRDLAPTVGMLPTPRASDGPKGAPGQRGSGGDLMLPSAVMGLLPTPGASDGKGAAGTQDRDRHGRPRPAGDVDLPEAVALLPTPSAGVHNDGEDLASWEARRARLLARGYNGNGQGTPLAVAVTAMLPTPAARERKGPGTGLPGRVRADGRVRGPGDMTLGLAVAGMSLLPTPTVHDRQGPRSAAGVAARASASGGPPRLLSETVANELLPTPTAAERHGPGIAPRATDSGGPPRMLTRTVVNDLLPTPQVHDKQGPKTAEQQATARAKGTAGRGRAHGVSNLNEAAPALLATPAGMTGGQSSRSGPRAGEPLLSGMASSATSGKPPGSTGSSTARPSPGGRPSPDDGLLTLFDLPS